MKQEDRKPGYSIYKSSGRFKIFKDGSTTNIPPARTMQGAEERLAAHIDVERVYKLFLYTP